MFLAFSVSYCTGINMLLYHTYLVLSSTIPKNYSHLLSVALYMSHNNYSASVIFWTDALSTGFKWRVTIFIVILTDHSNGFNSHLVQFHPFFGVISISKMVLENFLVLEPLEKCLLTAGNPCQKFLEFLWVFVSHHHNLTWFAFIPTISNNSITLLNLKI